MKSHFSQLLLSPSRLVRRSLAGVAVLALNVPLALGQSRALSSFGDSYGQHVFYNGSDGDVHQLFSWYPGAGWVDQDLTQTSGATSYPTWGTPMVSFADFAGEHAFYIGTDMHVNQLYFNGATWSNQDLTKSGGGVISNSWNSPWYNSMALCAFADGYGEHVFYTGTNLHLYQLYYNWGGNWVNQDLTQWSQANNLAEPSPCTSFGDSQGEHVFYMDTAGDTNHMFYNGVRWSNADLSLLTGTSGISYGTGDTGLSDFAGEHVFYVGTFQHIYEFQKLNPQASWQSWDMTKLMGVPDLPAWNTTLTTNSDSNGSSLFYIDSSEHVAQFHWTAGRFSAFTYADLTKTSGTTALADVNACSSLLTSFNNSYGEHVYYVDTGGAIHELYQPVGGGWSDAPLPASQGVSGYCP